MTEDDIGKLTLIEIEDIAARAEAAAQTLRSALALMRGGAVHAEHLSSAPPATARPVPVQHHLSDEQQAELNRWRNSPARQRLLEQARGSGADVEANGSEP